MMAMKNLFNISFLLIGLSCAYALNTHEAPLNSSKKLSSSQDSLKNEVSKSSKGLSKGKLINADTITALKNKISILEGRIENLQQVIDGMRIRSEQLKNIDVKSLEGQLQQKKDSIAIIKINISERDEYISKIIYECSLKESEKYNQGQQSVYNLIGQIYQITSFDSIINYSSLKSIERDLKLVGNNSDAKKKLEDLKIYFTAQEVLEVKYDAQKVSSAQSSLNSIARSARVKNLNERLGDYKLRCEGLKSTIGEIIKLDKRTIANNDDIHKMKMQDIMAELSSYLYNYSFNFEDYPYLSNLIFDLMKRKQKDTNNDISDLLSKL